MLYKLKNLQTSSTLTSKLNILTKVLIKQLDPLLFDVKKSPRYRKNRANLN
ncbi:hypothetical protein NTGM5_160104 [Candidatus Nitrotoga sp. M5]|nr:hypothetical protein NTGM5_160104 [Candidatus Nitrotoga sp. M5]